MVNEASLRVLIHPCLIISARLRCLIAELRRGCQPLQHLLLWLLAERMLHDEFDERMAGLRVVEQRVEIVRVELAGG